MKLNWFIASYLLLTTPTLVVSVRFNSSTSALEEKQQQTKAETDSNTNPTSPPIKIVLLVSSLVVLDSLNPNVGKGVGEADGESVGDTEGDTDGELVLGEVVGYGVTTPIIKNSNSMSSVQAA